MELAVKIYPDKPSRLGLLYTYEYQAVKAYEDLLRGNANESLHAMIEIRKGKAILTLTSGHTGKKTVYKDIEFRQPQIDKIRNFYKDGMPMFFVHIFTRANQFLIAKPFHRAEFLPVTAIELMLENQ